MKASSRSISPPWPGMRWLESLTPEAALDRRFEQIAELRTRSPRRGRPRTAGDAVRPAATSSKAKGRRRRAPRRSLPTRSCPARRAGHNLGPPISAAGEIGRDVGAPDDREKPQDRGQSVARAGAQKPEADDEGAGIEHRPRPPSPASPAARASRPPPPRGRARRRPRAQPDACESERIAQRRRHERQRARRHPLDEPIARSRAAAIPTARSIAATHQNATKTKPPTQAAASATDAHRHGRGDARPQVRTDPRAGRGEPPVAVRARAAHGHATVLMRPT